MAFHPDFPAPPHAAIVPEHRRFSTDETLRATTALGLFNQQLPKS